MKMKILIWKKDLSLIATKGVVQLFNAIRKQQKTVVEEVKNVNYEKGAKLSKEKFIELLNKSDSKINEVEKVMNNKKRNKKIIQ